MNKLTPDKRVVATNLAMYAGGGDCVWKGRTGEDIIQVLVMPHIPSYQKPCQVYYYQTKAPVAKKYGIAANSEKRAKSGSKSGHYLEKLSVFDCRTRAEALALESALGQCLTKKFTEDEYAKWANIVNMSSSELARESKEEFDEIFLGLQQQYQEMGNELFIRTHMKIWADQFDKAKCELESGKKIVLWYADEHIDGNCRDGSIRWTDKIDIECGVGLDPGVDIPVSLEEVPELFHRRYGFKLIPDSAWH